RAAVDASGQRGAFAAGAARRRRAAHRREHGRAVVEPRRLAADPLGISRAVVGPVRGRRLGDHLRRSLARHRRHGHPVAGVDHVGGSHALAGEHPVERSRPLARRGRGHPELQYRLRRRPVASEPLRGHVALPAMPVIPVSDGADPAPSLAAEAPRLRALVAGLDASSRKEASRWLASAGFEVVVADNTAAALDVFRCCRLDVVLADMGLRGEGGRSLVQLLGPQAEMGRVPMIALCSSRRDAAAALEGGADDLLDRPFDWRVASRRAEHLVRLADAASQLVRLQKETERLRTVLEEERQERSWLNQFDPLTGLPNGERLERALESALITAEEKSQVAVVLFDIEHLVLINSRLGRARVNSLLQQVAQRLFAAMLTGLPGWAETKATVRLLLDRISGRYFTADEEISLTASAGVALAPADGLTAEAMLQKAELAASEAVTNGIAIRFYGQSSHVVTERSRAITRLLPNALA